MVDVALDGNYLTEFRLSSIISEDKGLEMKKLYTLVLFLALNNSSDTKRLTYLASKHYIQWNA